jgi:hypothetical protein
MVMPLAILKDIGHQLDEDIFPRIKNGGIVTPGETAVPKSTWAEEKKDERQRPRRPETRPWTGPAGGQRQTDRGGTRSTAPPIVCADLQTQYEGELTAVHEAYPGTRVWHQEEGLWLLTESALLPGLWQKAVFLTGIPFARTRTVRSWGFWMGIPQRYPTWIGPRHTNFPDGSICAFEPSDGTWYLGNSLLVLLDLYTLWALRHLHLQVFQRWPGRQVAHHVHERLIELKPTECCGCGSNRPYSDCCQEKDLRSDRIKEAIRFFNFGQRTPPTAVSSFIQLQHHPPKIPDLLPMIQNR